MRETADTVRAMLTNGRGGLSGDEMALLPQFEIVCATGAGYEAIDLDTARRRGIVVAHCPDANAPAVADSAMLLLAATRHLLQADRFIPWRWMAGSMACRDSDPYGQAPGYSRSGKNRQQDCAARGFDMEIGYHNRAAVAGSPYRYFASLIELATWADFLVAAAPGGTGTRHLVNADVLAALGPQGYLVNVGRGTVVDTQALIEALRSKRVAGAGLDVLEGEPSVPPLLPELLQCDNVVVTLHVAGRAPESRAAATALILANLNAHLLASRCPRRSPSRPYRSKRRDIYGRDTDRKLQPFGHGISR